MQKYLRAFILGASTIPLNVSANTPAPIMPPGYTPHLSEVIFDSMVIFLVVAQVVVVWYLFRMLYQMHISKITSQTGLRTFFITLFAVLYIASIVLIYSSRL
ncbi:MAG: hypothetical protein KBC50_01850 [Candidatus Pacebacteria bacterium]|nr:hypothetical protein [Candidatus Paceibacterota bacterium]